MSAKDYLSLVTSLLERLGNEEYENIAAAGLAVATSLHEGHRIWITNTAHGVAHEATKRAGGFIPVHRLHDVVLVDPGDVILIASPVGVAQHTLAFAIEGRDRGGVVIALTNVAFEREPTTVVEHESGKRLHQVADIVIDIAGPTGDGVFDVPELQLRAIPHSGVTLTAGLWMIFSVALDEMRTRGITPRLYECDMIEGARAKNAAQIDAYLRTGVGYVTEDEIA